MGDIALSLGSQDAIIEIHTYTAVAHIEGLKEYGDDFLKQYFLRVYVANFNKMKHLS